MKVAVTGATGFVGRHVLRALGQRTGIDVTATSRTGAAGDLATAQHARWVALDIAADDADAFDRLGRPDALIHLAWGGLPRYRALDHFESQLPQQYRFLQTLARAGLPKLLCTGTCFEYGMRSGLLDEDLPANPHNPYAHAKDALRRQLEFLQLMHGFEMTWTRLFYMYGDDQPSTTLYAQVKAALQRDEAAFAMSPGDQLRDYLPVDDVARTLVALALDVPGTGVVNVCSGAPVSVRGLVERWIADSSKAMRIEPGRYPYADHEPRAFWGSTKKLDAALAGARAGRLGVSEAPVR